MTDEHKTTNSDDVNRRQFFLKLGLGSLTVAAAGTAAFAYQFLEPNVLYEPSPVVNAGKPDRYPLDSVTLDVNTGIYIIHSQEGYFSLSAVCLLTLLEAECRSSTLLAMVTPLALIQGPLPMRSRALTPAAPPGSVVLR